MTNKTLLLAVLLAATAALVLAKTQWHQLEQGYSFDDFVREFKPSYASSEELIQRKRIFENRLREIKQHNRDPTQTWKKGVNHLSDRTEQEIRSQMMGYDKHVAARVKQSSSAKPWVAPAALLSSNGQAVALPTSIDWRDKGVVTGVKDQGNCGSCWTFAAAETLESAWALATGELFTLSEQQILDCTPNPQECGGTGGCFGGTTELAYQRMMDFELGLSSEWTYPYISYFGANNTCQFNPSRTRVVAKVKSFVTLPANKQTPLLQAVATVGPIAVSVDASTWSSYESGLFNGCNQTNPDINHAVQLVGYGYDYDVGQNYWIIRNSWGPHWGEQGYIRLVMPDTPTCGEDLTPRDGTACKDGPPQVTVCGTCGVLFDSTYPIVDH